MAKVLKYATFAKKCIQKAYKAGINAKFVIDGHMEIVP